MMHRSASAEPAKSSSKRKGTRSVSTLTPSQLARKRANDREAQRAIRARTKEHIERLERELDDYRCTQGRDKTVQDLLRRNRSLEEEVRRLKDSASMSASITSSPYSAPAAVYDDNLSVASTMPSPQMSPLPSGPDYGSLPDYPIQQYVSQPKNCESWASSVGSPCSSVNDADYSSTPAYIPTSMPASMMHPPGSAKDVGKPDFDDMRSMAGPGSYMHPHTPTQPHHHQSPHHHSQQRAHGWGMYPMYYDGPSPTALASR